MIIDRRSILKYVSVLPVITKLFGNSSRELRPWYPYKLRFLATDGQWWEVEWCGWWKRSTTHALYGSWQAINRAKNELVSVETSTKLISRSLATRWLSEEDAMKFVQNNKYVMRAIAEESERERGKALRELFLRCGARPDSNLGFKPWW